MMRCFFLWLISQASVSMLSTVNTPAQTPTSVQFVSSGFRAGESGTWSVELRLSGSILKGPVTVPIIVGGTATPGEDFEFQDTETLDNRTTLVRFSPDTSHAFLSLLLQDDGIPEKDETIVLELGQLPEGIVAGSRRSMTITIENLKSIVWLRESTLTECNCTTVLHLDRFGDRNFAETFNYTTGANDPIDGPIFVPTNGTVSFAPGEREKTIEIQLHDDGLPWEFKSKFFGVEFRRTNGVSYPYQFSLRVRDAQEPVEDPGFYPETRAITAATQRSDGKILVAEEMPRQLVQLDENGRRERTWPITLTGLVHELFWLPDGKILLVWQQDPNQGSNLKLVRLLPDGSLDQSFTPPDNLGRVDQFQSLSDGRVLFTAYNTSLRTELRRLNADGTLDSTFKPLSDIGRFVVDEQDRIIAVRFGYPKTWMNTLLRMRSDGSVDNTFRLDASGLDVQLPGYQFTEAFQVAPDGTIYALLHLYVDGFGAIAILGEDGSIRRTFRLTIYTDRGFCLGLEPDGHVVLGNGSNLWRVDPVKESLLRLPARLEGLSEWESLEVLGVHGNNVLLRSNWRRPSLFWPPTSRLLKIPLNSSPSTAIIIEPDDDADWLELTPAPPIPTAAPEGRDKRIRIQRRGDVRQPAAVTISTRELPAKAGEDFLPASVRLEFQPFETEKIVPITVLSDDQGESEETFEVVLSDPIGADAIAPPMRIRVKDSTSDFHPNAVRRLSANQVEITYHWPRGSSCQLQWSDDLRTWRELPATPANSQDGLRVVDEHPLSAKARFYRLWRQ